MWIQTNYQAADKFGGPKRWIRRFDPQSAHEFFSDLGDGPCDRDCPDADSLRTGPT